MKSRRKRLLLCYISLAFIFIVYLRISILFQNTRDLREVLTHVLICIILALQQLLQHFHAFQIFPTLSIARELTAGNLVSDSENVAQFPGPVAFEIGIFCICRASFSVASVSLAWGIEVG